MEQITKEYLAEQFEKQFVRLTGYINGRLENFVTKEYLDQRLSSKTSELKTYVDEKVEGVLEAIDHRFNQVDDRLTTLEVDMKVVKGHLHVSLNNHV